MSSTNGYAALEAGKALEPFRFERRAIGPNDVHITISHCGICHSDIHQARDEWGGSIFPMVPGHEIVGTVLAIGTDVKSFHPGETVGVGCLVDSCQTCHSCQRGLEQYCQDGLVFTYNSRDKAGEPTYGGYSTHIVVDQRFVFHIPTSLTAAGAAPLLCAGITTYSPLKHWNVGHGHKLGVLGLGGLGHMAVQLGNALGAEVTVLSRSSSKQPDAARLGAKDFALVNGQASNASLAGRFDFIIDTVSAPHDYTSCLEMLKTDGTLILVGAPEQPTPLGAFPLVMRRRRMVGSLIGGIPETQEMLDFCAENRIESEVEIIPIQGVNEAYERIMRGDVRFRFVIDMSSLGRE
ncbi:MAG: NAD(P)-dependent alcohol dehydrogenase [Nitrospirales bacterium]|nr:NAD(P)-dependent alcohol dehydrogenase [Nitrospira sp.]MDR4502881.1 NAD(P)-dependent alcohol dehydrogenase [Nitrospirales bacterium]